MALSEDGDKRGIYRSASRDLSVIPEEAAGLRVRITQVPHVRMLRPWRQLAEQFTNAPGINRHGIGAGHDGAESLAARGVVSHVVGFVVPRRGGERDPFRDGHIQIGTSHPLTPEGERSGHAPRWIIFGRRAAGPAEIMDRLIAA